MSIRRAQDERIEGTPDGLNAITEIMDVPDAPTIGTAVDNGNVDASVTFTAAVTGGTPFTYTVTSTPGSFTGTGSSSPITVSGLTAGTSYTFKVKAANAAGTYGPESVASNSVTPAFPVSGAYDSLAAVTLSASASSITFSGIPTGYKHLQIRAMLNGTSGTQDVYTQFNGDTGSNYSFHGLYGSGSAAAAYGYASQTKISTGVNLAGYGSGSAFSVGIIDLLDYASTTKYKTMRVLNGFDTNNGTTSINNESIALASGLWQSTSAITSIYMYPSAGSFAQYSSFALYGVK